MGERGNIVVRTGSAPHDPANDVWFYTHWKGEILPGIVRAALARRERWDDPSYLARIVFCELVGDDTKEATGYGISTSIGDNNYPIVVVDPANQMVYVIPEAELFEGRLLSDLEGVYTHACSFEDYIGPEGGTSPFRGMARGLRSV